MGSLKAVICDYQDKQTMITICSSDTSPASSTHPTNQHNNLPPISLLFSPVIMSEIIHAYRTLLRSSLRAVQFSKPARYVVQRRVREAFEKGTPEAYDAEAVRRTVWFLKAAAEERGLEHKIVKNLVRVAWERVRGPNRPGWRSSVRRAESRRLRYVFCSLVVG